MVGPEEARQLAKVARLYYEDGLRQAEIAHRLDLSQATVSRLLKRALEQRVVRISVTTPVGYYPELERGVREEYGLKDVIVVDHTTDEDRLLRNLGSAAAFYLESTIKPDDVIGVSSWSESLLATAEAMHPLRSPRGERVVQIEGGIGDPNSEAHASRMTQRLAELCGTEAVMLPAPGVVGSVEARAALETDPYVQSVIRRWDDVTLALVGIGTPEPSRLLAQSGNAFSEAERRSLADAGAVGDINLHFFDATGKRIESSLDERVISMGLDQLRRVQRCVAVAGSERKWRAIRAAIRGGWVHVLVTDGVVARRLLDDSS
jgi:DNA-binding transcriptional regulator LsrR (DeoR family)